jgi:predicted phage-related endonuclease|nr:MAG TPA: Exonuclease [Bacteriophage sp.]
MSTNEIAAKVQELRELRRMADELDAEIDSLQDAIKQHMDAAGVDTLAGLDYKITYKAVISSRVDTTALKKDLPEIAARYTKMTTARRFTFV